jgi:hypothetical protein
MHNTFQDQLVDKETRRQQLVEEAIAHEQSVAEAIRQMHLLRQRVGGYFETGLRQLYPAFVPQESGNCQSYLANSKRPSI